MKLLLLIVLASAIVLNQNGAYGRDNIRTESQIAEQFYKYFTKSQNVYDIVEFGKLVDIFSFPKYFYRDSFETYTQPRQTLTCMICRAVINTVSTVQAEGQSEEEIMDILADLCTLLEIQPAAVCRGVILLNVPIILYVMRNKATFSGETFCGVVFQSNNVNECPFEDDEYNWSIELPAKNVTIQPPQPTEETFKIVQVSDLHYDPIYEPYGLADCNEPTCCRLGQEERASPRWNSIYDDQPAEDLIIRGEKGTFKLDLSKVNVIQDLITQANLNISQRAFPESKQAGYWGDYRHCDAPWWAVEDAISKVVENHDDFDIVYYTGDTIDHGVWETTRELIAASTERCMSELRNKFGDRPVFPAVGNHESNPVNQFAPPSVTDPNLSSAWMYELYADKWSSWLPADTVDTIKLGGYYTVLVRPNLRVVSINSNICYRQNWWVQLEPNDPSGQLKWLVDVLTKAEQNNEIVHILSHVPAGRPDCYYVYTREYKRIIERFSDIIAAEFNGHTHNDEFKLFYSEEDKNKPIAIAWNGGSVTSNANINPNYKIYQVNSNNYEVVDFDTWIYNLTEANLSPDQRPAWFKEYNFKEHYGMASLSLENLDNLVTRMVTTDKNLLQSFHRFRGKTSDAVNPTCDGGCIQDLLRIMTTTVLYDDSKSEELWALYQGSGKK